MIINATDFIGVTSKSSLPNYLHYLLYTINFIPKIIFKILISFHTAVINI